MIRANARGCGQSGNRPIQDQQAPSGLDSIFSSRRQRRTCMTVAAMKLKLAAPLALAAALLSAILFTHAEAPKRKGNK